MPVVFNLQVENTEIGVLWTVESPALILSKYFPSKFSYQKTLKINNVNVIQIIF